jgi:multidrug efflux pump subunit AcrA (membrane-fusion protein)
LLARIRDGSNTVQEFRSPVDGAIASLAISEGAAVASGQPIALLSPDRATITDALRALAYVGTKDDLPLIEPWSQGTTTNDAEIRQQAASTVKAIESRTAKN